MKDNRIGCVIVVDESNSSNNPVGMVTERDIIYNLSSQDANLQIPVNAIMSKPIVTIQAAEGHPSEVMDMSFANQFFNRCIKNDAKK
jgi:S-adenosylhomocysteine hydrolase